MRYLHGDLNHPSPLYARLWEARRGALWGFALCALWLGLLVGVLFVLAAFERNARMTNYGLAGLYFLLHNWRFIVLIACGSAWKCLMQELDTVNQGKWTLERTLDYRLKAIEDRVFPECFSQPEQPKSR